MDRERWAKLSLFQQMGNIGSELARARHWEERRDGANRDGSLKRTFELLDFMLQDQRYKGRYKELARFREVVGDCFLDKESYDISLKSLEEYCLPFALHAGARQ